MAFNAESLGFLEGRMKSHDHLAMDTLRQYAAGALSTTHAVAVEEHLDVCADGRCTAFLADAGRGSRTFVAKELVWGAFASLAEELDTTPEALLPIAMEEYAKTSGYTFDRAPAARGVLKPQPRPFTAPRGGEVRAAAPLLNEMSAIEETVDARNIASPLDLAYHDDAATDSDDSLDRTKLRNRVSRPPPPSAQDSSSRAVTEKRLVLTYQGRAHEVDKDRFLLGRSKTQADLRLDDANVSRQHAVIERVGSAWYVVDLGSTNGVQVQGERVTRRALSDGDRIVITTHEIRCSLR